MAKRKEAEMLDQEKTRRKAWPGEKKLEGLARTIEAGRLGHEKRRNKACPGEKKQQGLARNKR